MASGRALFISGGLTKQLADADQLQFGTWDRATAGTLTIGGTNATAASIAVATTLTASGTALTVNNNATVTGVLTSTGGINANGGIDRATNAALYIGGTNATDVNIGRTGQKVYILGDLDVAGAEAVHGTATFDTDATFKGDVTFGDGTGTDDISFNATSAQIITDIKFGSAANRAISVKATTAASDAVSFSIVGSSATTGAAAYAGGFVNVTAGVGSAASATVVGGVGGNTVLTAGAGGAGSADRRAGDGGTVVIVGGDGGANGGFAGDSLGGDVTINGGLSTGESTPGSVYLGNGNTTNVVLGSDAAGLRYNVASKIFYCLNGGNIKLPNNVDARFMIEDVSVGETVTAANLDELTDGSTTTLHTHAGIGGSATTIEFVSATAGENLSAGALVGSENSTGSKAFHASGVASGNRHFPIGVAKAAISSGSTGQIVASGEVTVPDAVWDDSTPIAAASTGKKVYLSATNAGNWTTTPPSTAGDYLTAVGIITFASGTANVTRVALNIGDTIAL